MLVVHRYIRAFHHIPVSIVSDAGSKIGEACVIKHKV